MRPFCLTDFYRLVILTAVLTNTLATHFRGGTISWKTVGGRKVEFFFKMGWTYGSGPGCTEQKIGQFVNDPLLQGRGDPFNWICTSGCPSKPILHSPSYNCMAANRAEGWEQGQMKFNYTFPGSGPFVVEFEGFDWMQLGNNKGNGPWSISTTVDLRSRNDTGQPNNSPVALSQAIYYMQFDCKHELKIPVLDPDGDEVRCEWAAGDECEVVCDGLPGAVLDEKTCTIKFESSTAKKYVAGEFYAVALTVRDFPKTPITLDGQDKTPSDSLSSVPIQFLIKTPTFNDGCDDKPRFVHPSPPEGGEVLVQAGELSSIVVAADNNRNDKIKVKSIDVIGPVGLQQSSLTQDTSRTNTFQKTLTWQTSDTDIGEHIVCARAINDIDKTGDPRCFTIKVVPDPCDAKPCLNGATCHSSKANFTCACVVGFTGRLCEINIDDCQTDPCKNDGVCHDLINDYVCVCVPGFTDKNCTTDIDDCVSDPCINGGNCTDQVNDFTCVCPPGYTGKNCHIGVDFCKPKPCLNGGICHNGFAGFKCQCVNGWQGKICDYRSATAKRSTCTKRKAAVTALSHVTKNDACCQTTEYSDCECFISPHIPPEEVEMDQNIRDLLCALIGFPLGLGLSVLTFNLFRRWASRTGPPRPTQIYRAKHPPAKRCLNLTESWINSQMTSVESPELRTTSASSGFFGIDGQLSEADHSSSSSPTASESPQPMNIYRATFTDESMHSTGPKKNPDTYISGVTDWSTC
ncbi:hypothetical protein RRG08_033750 [Elysia crispata]|uniref:EGF-like domain-containing protein n=1 Tax=Elysia crispata TaxID=231223 RepID=A0AAE1AU74_9GAST|nr:hypothetical protein RRG08_033750 [Elysia crispata]